jgi:hypothetical protein
MRYSGQWPVGAGLAVIGTGDGMQKRRIGCQHPEEKGQEPATLAAHLNHIRREGFPPEVAPRPRREDSMKKGKILCIHCRKRVTPEEVTSGSHNHLDQAA